MMRELFDACCISTVPVSPLIVILCLGQGLAATGAPHTTGSTLHLQPVHGARAPRTCARAGLVSRTELAALAARVARGDPTSTFRVVRHERAPGSKLNTAEPTRYYYIHMASAKALRIAAALLVL